MAEFVEVMRQARRLCETKKCRECPLSNRDPIMGIAMCMLHPSKNNEDDVNYAELESTIMKWAKEHPEPVYPSWAEAWNQLFPTEGRNQLFKTAGDYMCPAYFGEKHRNKQCGKITCWECKSEPMHPEVAEKLGVKPKEANE